MAHSRLFSTPLRPLVAALGAAAAISATAPEASACGGFFCSSSPVDQTAEHILFEINADHTVTAIVQISYSGDRDAFAWIVPVPGLPTLAAGFPDLGLMALDSATQPSYFKQQCSFAAPEAAGAGGATSTGGPSVTVLDQKLVGPYETVTLSATNATDLVSWLQTNGFRITDPMIPVLQPYIENGLHFVALKLQADRTAADVTPLEMTYQADKPMIPIRLTSVAAQPEMGIVTWILADRRWGPDNYVGLKIPDDLIEFDQYGYQNNYLKLVSEQIDKVGGQAFVTEYAKGTGDLLTQLQNQSPGTAQGEAARQELLALLAKFPYITRLYTRMSAEEMVVGSDPTFIVSGDQSEVANVHDLTPPGFDYSQCTYAYPPVVDPPDPCFLTYCGRRGACVPTTTSTSMLGTATTVPSAACVCAADATARATTTAYGQPLMYCEPLAMNLDGATGTGSGTATTVSACEGFSCGAHGECVAMNGNPSCRCEFGYGAVASTTYDPTTGATVYHVTCEPVGYRSVALPLLPPIGETRLAPGQGAGEVTGGCSVAAPGSASRSRAPWAGVGSAAFGLTALGAFRARRRQRPRT